MGWNGRRSDDPGHGSSVGEPDRGGRLSVEAPRADGHSGAGGCGDSGSRQTGGSTIGAFEERGEPFVNLMDRLYEYRSEEAKLKCEGSFAEYFDLVKKHPKIA